MYWHDGVCTEVPWYLPGGLVTCLRAGFTGHAADAGHERASRSGLSMPPRPPGAPHCTAPQRQPRIRSLMRTSCSVVSTVRDNTCAGIFVS